MTERVGIIDIGSNTIRLVIYEQAASSKNFKEIENIKKYARLRSYFDHTQSLNEEGIRLLISSLQDFEKILQHYHVNHITCVATASIRQAANKEAVLQSIKEKTHIPLTILSEQEEAFYGYVSVIHSTNIKEGITIDIGGGSTEVTYFHDRQLIDYHSFPFGALSLKLQFVSGNLPTPEEREEISQYIKDQIQTLPWLSDRHIPVIAIGGSARNVAQMHQQFTKYPLSGIHQYEMNTSDLGMVKGRILPLSFSELQKTEGLSKERADTIMPAIEVFKVLCDVSKATKFITSRKGLRDGILYQNWMNRNHVSPPLADASIDEFIEDFNIGAEDVTQITKIAVIFFEQIEKIKGNSAYFSDEDLTLLKRAARIYLLGKKVDEESSNTAFSLLSNRTLLGFSHRERLKLVLVASYIGKGTFQKYLRPFKDWFTKEEQTKLTVLGAILKIAKSLNATHQDIVLGLDITPVEDRWLLNIRCQGYFRSEEYHFERQKKHLEKLLKISLIPHFEII